MSDPTMVPAPQPVSTGGSPFRVVIDGEPEAQTYANEHTALAAGIRARLLHPDADVRVVQYREWRIEPAVAPYRAPAPDPQDGAPPEPEPAEEQEEPEVPPRPDPGPLPEPGGAMPELPRVRIDPKYVHPGGNTIRVRAGDNLQAALDAAKPGDIIELQAGATFKGNFVLRAKGGSQWIVIRTSAELPPEGTRITPNFSGFAKIVSPNSGRALHTEDGASYYRLMGLELTIDPSVTSATAILELGSSGQTMAGMPKHIVVDRCYIHGHDNLSVQRCVS